jgi:hypothetical protein
MILRHTFLLSGKSDGSSHLLLVEVEVAAKSRPLVKAS